MPTDLSGTSYKDFLKKQLEVLPPTPEQTVWATEGFSTRVDPPKETVTPVDSSGG